MQKSLNAYYLCFSLICALTTTTWADAPKLKYGDTSVPLSRSHTYFQKHSAPLFWSLIPYYVPQIDGSACSVASVAMVVNAARVGMKLSTENQLVTQEELVKKVKNPAWGKNFTGYVTRGVSLEQLGTLLTDSLKLYGVTPTSVEVVHTNDMSTATQKKLHEALAQTEKSSRTFVVANFLQGTYTSDGEYGHIAPIGAYDSENKKVLVLDPDRAWYEPYWVSEETFLKGMVPKDKYTGKSRGYVVVKLPE